MRLKPVTGLWVALCLCAPVTAQTWERLGPDGGLVVSLATDAQRGLYLGTADGHVFYSADGAQSWKLRGRVGSRLDAVVTGLVADPRGGHAVYASVWYQSAGAGGGVFHSEDGGRTWILLGLRNEAVRALEIAPWQAEELIAGTRTGVFRSRDAGKSWERISPEGDQELRNIDSLAIDPRNADVIYAGTYHLPWRTQDGGKSWQPVGTGMIDDSDVMSLRIDASNPERLFLSACSGIYRSENQGAQWIKLQGIPYSARRTQSIVQDPGNPKTLFAGTTEGLWVTRDGAESWTRTTSKDWVVNSVVVLSGGAGVPGRVVLGTEGRGIQVSEDGGVHFRDSNEGFTHMLVRQFVVDANREGHFLMLLGRAEQPLVETTDSGASWTAVNLGLRGRGEAAQLNVDQVAQMYASPWGWLLRMADGQFWLREEQEKEREELKEESWKEWRLHAAISTAKGRKEVASKSTAGAQSASTGPISFSRDAAFVATSSGLMRCGRSGACSALKACGRGGAIRAVWVSGDGQGVAVVSEGKLGMSMNGGETGTWRDLPVAMDDVIWVDAAGAGSMNTILLGTNRGLFSRRGGDTPWTQVNGGLPQGAVTRMLRGTGFWMVTERDGGMYASHDQGASWERVNGDGERGEFAGLARVGSRGVLVGSQSEGLLKLTLPEEVVGGN